MIPDRDVFGKALRLSCVQRWNTVALVKHQSVAEHSFNVAILAQFIFASVYPDRDPPRELFWYALMHDAEEAVTGDIPGPAKKSGEVTVARKFEGELMDPDLYAMLKDADCIETAAYIELYGADTPDVRVRKADAARVMGLRRYHTHWPRAFDDAYKLAIENF